MRFLVINGPDTSIGTDRAAQLDEKFLSWGSGLGVDVEVIRAAGVGDITELIERFDGDGIVINPGEILSESQILADAMRSSGAPIVDVDISAGSERGSRPIANMSATGGHIHTIRGRGISGYRDALRHLLNRAAMPFEILAYGSQEDQVGDLRGVGSELIVFVHGGLWLQEYARDTIEGLAVDAARRGFRSWNLEFRRLGGGGGWPASGRDVLTALDFVSSLDGPPSRVVVVSHSAGSQLALWAAEQSATTVDLHVAMGPLLDLKTAVAEDDVGAAECARMLDGGAPPVNRPDRIETVIVHGRNDQIVPLQRSEAIVSGTDVELHIPDTDHFAVLDHESETWNWVMERIGS